MSSTFDVKDSYVVFLAATWKPLYVTPSLLKALPEIEAPKNYADPVKKTEYVMNATKKRDAELSDLWPLKQIDQIGIEIVNPDGSTLFDTRIGSITLVESLAGVWPHYEQTKIFGVGVRDILRVVARRYGSEYGCLVPYPLIADQRGIVDPLSVFDTGDVKKYLDPLFVLKEVGFEIKDAYEPHFDVHQDLGIARQFYHRFSRPFQHMKNVTRK